jgi:glycosyltransferase involved in cell wall biosynthesis
VELLGDGKYGLLFERENTQDLARCLVRFAKDIPLRSEMGARARQAAMEYTSAKMCERVQAVYEKILAEGSR